MNNKFQRIDNVLKPDCTGCSACSAICPKQCIKMQGDSAGGFLYPSIQEEKCINCGLCSKTCQAISCTFTLKGDIKAYVGSVSDEEKKECASGGVASAISEAFIRGSGVVYGCVFTSELKVVHQRAATVGEAIPFRKSKYIQSNIESIFRLIEQDLKNDTKVLFTGTSCQCVAIYKYLETKDVNSDKLYTLNVLCHGVSSQYLFDIYRKEQEEKYGKIKSYIFRNKKPINGVVNSRTAEIVYDNGQNRLVGIEQDPFLKMYYSKLGYRPSCMSCKYAKRERISDITLSDAWKIEQLYKELNPLFGVSMILVNSPKGRDLFDIMKREQNGFECISSEWALNSQKLFSEPSKAHKNRDVFINNYLKEGFANSVWKYTRPKLLIRFKIIVKRLLNYFINNG